VAPSSTKFGSGVEADPTAHADMDAEAEDRKRKSDLAGAGGWSLRQHQGPDHSQSGRPIGQLQKRSLAEERSSSHAETGTKDR
jgi:hypothetical protein